MTMSDSVVILISGRGSNLQAILESGVGNRVAAVISDNPGAAGLNVAAKHGKPTHVIPRRGQTKEAFEDALSECIEQYNPALIALAGFMTVVSGAFIARHQGYIVNIHPSLLPALRGLETHKRALAAGVPQHGCSVHWVTESVDAGDVIARQAVRVENTDDEEALAARVLEAEHRLYPATISRLLNQRKWRD